MLNLLDTWCRAQGFYNVLVSNYSVVGRGRHEYSLIGGDRCISGHISQLYVLQEQVAIMMT